MQNRDILRWGEDGNQRFTVDLVRYVGTFDSRGRQLSEGLGVEAVGREYGGLAAILVPQRQFHLAGRQLEQVAADVCRRVALRVIRRRGRQVGDVLARGQARGTEAKDVERRARARYRRGGSVHRVAGADDLARRVEGRVQRVLNVLEYVRRLYRLVAGSAIIGGHFPIEVPVTQREITVQPDHTTREYLSSCRPAAL